MIGRMDRQRAAAQAYGDYLRALPAGHAEAGAALIEVSNDVALRGSEW
jgi:hypothetical protein